MHAVATLEAGNLSCIPVYPGATWPLINTPHRFQAWETIHGKLPWEGAFAPENKTFEAEGNDPTSGDPNRIVKEAFKEGYPKGKPKNSTSAANFMVEMVHKHPGQVSIYSAGALTNIALAVRMDPNFASLAKELVIMGGYVDLNMLEATGSIMQADYQSDVSENPSLVFLINIIHTEIDQPHDRPRSLQDRTHRGLPEHHDCRQRRQPGIPDQGIRRRDRSGAESLHEALQ